jgi:glutathione synthase/RimK-type ligase-like ATP-grasp enzyme
VEAAVRATEAIGLDYAGVDLVETARGPLVLEVNGTPLFQGIFEATAVDVAPAIVAHALRRAARGRPSEQSPGTFQLNEQMTD